MWDDAVAMDGKMALLWRCAAGGTKQNLQSVSVLYNL